VQKTKVKYCIRHSEITYPLSFLCISFIILKSFILTVATLKKQLYRHGAFQIEIIAVKKFYCVTCFKLADQFCNGSHTVVEPCIFTCDFIASSAIADTVRRTVASSLTSPTKITTVKRLTQLRGGNNAFLFIGNEFIICGTYVVDTKLTPNVFLSSKKNWNERGF